VIEQQLLMMGKRSLAILRHAEEITGNVALTCRSYGHQPTGVLKVAHLAYSFLRHAGLSVS
jgi:hypothetical protein